jgi:hypothetical protein
VPGTTTWNCVKQDLNGKGIVLPASKRASKLFWKSEDNVITSPTKDTSLTDQLGGVVMRSPAESTIAIKGAEGSVCNWSSRTIGAEVPFQNRGWLKIPRCKGIQ